MTKKEKATLERNIARRYSGALYKYIVKNGKKKSCDINDILRRGFDANNCGGSHSGQSTPERAIRILKRFPEKVDPNVVKRIVLQTYSLKILVGFMRDQPGLVTEEDLHTCVKNMSVEYEFDKYEGYADNYLRQIEANYPELKGTPIWEAFITAQLVHS
jgi:hypothetical protein